jgi:thioredoxin 1
MPVHDDTNFANDVSKGISVVKFISLWDSSSRTFEDSFRELSDEFRGKVNFLSSDLHSNPLLAQKQGITKIPSVVIYVNGKQAAKMGNVTKRFLREQIQYFIKKIERLE